MKLYGIHFNRNEVVMLEKYFCSNFLDCIHSLILKELLEEIVLYFVSRGHTQRMVKEYVRIVGHFIYWLDNEHLSLPTSEEEIVHRFYDEHLPVCQCPVLLGPRFRYKAALRHIMNVLRREGTIVSPPVKSKEPLDTIIDDFKNHLIDAFGATCSTRSHYTRYARYFLEEIYANSSFDLARLTSRDILGFFTWNVQDYTPGTMQSIATSVRSLVTIHSTFVKNNIFILRSSRSIN